MHTPLCRHARGEPVQLAEHAVQLGLREIGFSDHSPMPQDGFDDWRMLAGELDRYVRSVEKARELFPQLTIRLGLEVDFIPGYESWIRELRAKYPWDYFIGSVHYLSGSGRGWALDSPYELEPWKRRPTYAIWAEYFDRLGQAACSGLFEIIGHADLCKKFGHYPAEDCTPLLRNFLASARMAGVAVELNTAGLRKTCREIYPSHAFLRLACESGIPITFGSDAHAPEEVGLNFAEAVKWARDAGYADYVIFEEGRKTTRQLT